MNTTPVFAVLRPDVRGAVGRSYYQARECGSVTCLRKFMWTTTVRANAERLAGEVGGVVVEHPAVQS